MQAQELPMDAANRDTMTQIFSRIWKNEGVRGLYRGLLPNIIKVVPAVSLSYVVYEHMKRLLVPKRHDF
jgi:solute carrier family 25 phosphate transporter 23/24/25/41